MSTPKPLSRGLGRIVEPDIRDLGHLMRAARPQAFKDALSQLPAQLAYERGPVLDQGRTGTCVAHSLVSKLHSQPVACLPPRAPEPFALYDRAIQLDEWAANDLDTERAMGTSVRAGCKALTEMGLITAYHWAFDVDEVLHWILSGQGGLVLGIEWLREMGNPSAEGIIRARGRSEGGHAIYCYGADRERGLIDLQQSWGEGHGGWLIKAEGEHRRVNAGCVRLPLDDLRRLLDRNGEAVAIVESPLPEAP